MTMPARPPAWTSPRSLRLPFRRFGLAAGSVSLLAMAAAANGPVAAPNAGPQAPAPANDGAAKPAAKPQSPYPGIPDQFAPALDELAKQNPRLIPAWREVRELQEEWKRLFGTFGKQARRDAERGMANADRALERAMRTFRAEYDRLHVPWSTQENGLREKAAKLSARPADPSEARQKERDAELSKLYMDANAVHERLSTLGKLEESVTIKTQPTRLDQLGVPRHSESSKGLMKADIDQLLPPHLALRDATADVEALEARKKANEAAWRPADHQQLLAAQREVDKAMEGVEKVLAGLKKPNEAKKIQLTRALDSLNKRIESTQKAKRPTERLETEATQLAKQIADLDAAIAAYETFAGWKAFKDKRAAAQPPKP